MKDFSGGSAEVLNIDQEKRLVRLNPTTHQDRGWVCWWYVKLSGLTPGETVTLDVGNAPWATPDRAAFSLDNKTWRLCDLVLNFFFPSDFGHQPSRDRLG